MVRSDVTLQDQSRVGRALTWARARRAAARPALGRPARGHPRRPAAAWSAPPPSRDLAAELGWAALGRHRGLRPARRACRRRTGRLRHPRVASGPGRHRPSAARARPDLVSRVDPAPACPTCAPSRWGAGWRLLGRWPPPCPMPSWLPRPGRASPAMGRCWPSTWPGRAPGRPGRPDRNRGGVISMPLRRPAGPCGPPASAPRPSRTPAGTGCARPPPPPGCGWSRPASTGAGLRVDDLDGDPEVRR